MIHDDCPLCQYENLQRERAIDEAKSQRPRKTEAGIRSEVAKEILTETEKPCEILAHQKYYWNYKLKFSDEEAGMYQREFGEFPKQPQYECIFCRAELKKKYGVE
jgi:hypothetical protein